MIVGRLWSALLPRAETNAQSFVPVDTAWRLQPLINSRALLQHTLFCKQRLWALGANTHTACIQTGVLMLVLRLAYMAVYKGYLLLLFYVRTYKTCAYDLRHVIFMLDIYLERETNPGTHIPNSFSCILDL